MGSLGWGGKGGEGAWKVRRKSIRAGCLEAGRKGREAERE